MTIHAYLSINWIFTAATGIIYYYLPEVSGRKKIYSEKLAKLQIFTNFNIGFGNSFLCLRKIRRKRIFRIPPYIVILIVSSWI